MNEYVVSLTLQETSFNLMIIPVYVIPTINICLTLHAIFSNLDNMYRSLQRLKCLYKK